MEKEIRVANAQDVDGIVQFLEKSEVSTEGIESTIDHFILMEDVDKNIIATLGIERIEQDGLLRSLVVSPKVAQTDILALFKSVISLAKHKEMNDLYLSTNKEASVTFFMILGFGQVEKSELSEHLLTSAHIKQILPLNNTILMKSKLSVKN